MKIGSYIAAVSGPEGTNWNSPGSPVGNDFSPDYYMWLTPMSRSHPPSLKRPNKPPIPNPWDGWEKGASKNKRARAKRDLKEIHQKILRQIGRPTIAIVAPVPQYPSLMQIT